MRRLATLLVAGFLLAAQAGCLGLFRKKSARSAEEELLGFEDGRDRLRDTSVGDIEREAAQPRNGLALRIRTTKSVYKPDEPIVLDVRLHNVTGGVPGQEARDIPVYFEIFATMPDGQRGPWLLKPELRSEDMGKVIYRAPDFEVPREDRERYYHYVTLPPGAFVGTTFTFPRNWLPPGREFSFLCTYEVSDEYPRIIINRHLSPEQAEMLGWKLAYVRVWTGRLYSNRARFRIERTRRFLGLF